MGIKPSKSSPAAQEEHCTPYRCVQHQEPKDPSQYTFREFHGVTRSAIRRRAVHASRRISRRMCRCTCPWRRAPPLWPSLLRGRTAWRETTTGHKEWASVAGTWHSRNRRISRDFNPPEGQHNHRKPATRHQKPAQTRKISNLTFNTPAVLLRISHQTGWILAHVGRV